MKEIQVIVEKDDVLLNYISLIPANQQKFPCVNYNEAMKFVDWLTSQEGQIIIRDFVRINMANRFSFLIPLPGKS